MKKKLRSLIALLAILITFYSCNQVENTLTYEVKGSIKGIETGVIILKKNYQDTNPRKIEIKDGEFLFSLKKVTEPKNINLEVENTNYRFSFYFDNAAMIYEGELVENEIYKGSFSIKNINVTGCIVNDHNVILNKERERIMGLYDYKNAPENQRSSVLKKRSEALNDNQEKFIREHPNAYFSCILATRLSKGRNAEGIKKLLEMLDPKLNNSLIEKLHVKMAEMEKIDVKTEDIIKADNVSYAIENTFKGEQHKNVIYLGVLSNDNVCALTKEGKIQIINSEGEEVSSFKPEQTNLPTTLAVDKSDNIYVMYPLQKKFERKVRGKEYKGMETYAYECIVYNTVGEEQNKFKLDNLKTATGSRVMDDKLLVADWRNRIIGIFNAKTGVKESVIENMRPCCMILDFSINANNEVLVANLGAFRVQSFDLTGKNLIAFGQRGKTESDFHGCCNPVSVAYLSNGAIVTVEKSPTRVKIFSRNGAKKIAGIEELVDGCNYIPMIVDSNDNLYLSSPEKGMIKCVSIN